MSWRDRLARMLAPRSFQTLAKYNEHVPSEWLDALEMMRAQALETLPPGFQFLGFPTESVPSKSELLAGSVTTADFAARAIANRISTLRPIIKIRKRKYAGTVKEETLDDHPYQKLLDNPHPSFSTKAMLNVTAKHIVLTGEAYWNKVRNGFGMVQELQLILPSMVTPFVQKGVVEAYVVRQGNGALVKVPASEMLRFWIPDPETLYTARGYLKGSWSNHIATIYAEKHLESFYEHDATPTTYLQGQPEATAPGKTAKDAFDLLWRMQYARLSGSSRGNPAWIPPGWELKATDIQKGNEMVPLLDFWMRHQLMNFGVPRSVLGEVISGDRSSAETNQYVFDMHSVKPIADVITDTLTMGLAQELDPRLFFCFEDFIAEDKAYVLRQEEADIKLKIRSPQQILEDRGGDPERAPWGEFPPGTANEQPYTGEKPPEPTEAGAGQSAGDLAEEEPGLGSPSGEAEDGAAAAA